MDERLLYVCCFRDLELQHYSSQLDTRLTNSPDKSGVSAAFQTLFPVLLSFGGAGHDAMELGGGRHPFSPLFLTFTGRPLRGSRSAAGAAPS